MEEVIIYASLALLLLGSMLLFFFIMYRLKLNRSIKERKDMENRSTQALLQTKVEIREQTLKDVSLEIHDNIAQVLSLAKMHLSSADESQPDQLISKLDSAKELVSRSILDLRDLSRSLNPDHMVNFNLIRSLQIQVDQIIKSGSYEVNFFVTGGVKELADKVEVILYRMIQEILQNTIKHAKATRIDLELLFDSDGVKISVVDNGIGFSTGQVLHGQGFKNLMDRAAVICGSCDIVSSEGEGTKVVIFMPVT